MRKLRLLSTVAASLLLSVGVAAAQSPSMQGQTTQAPARAPAAQQNAPAEKVAPPMKGGERKAPETTGQSSTQMKPGETKAGASGESSKDKMNSSAGEKSKTEMKENKAEGASGSKTNQSTTEKKSTTTTTTGQGAAAGASKLSSEQRTKITTVIRSQKVARVEPSKLNVSIRVGARVPPSVHFYPLPAEVVTIYPEWRGYDYILVGDQIVILDPRTHEIVAILEA